MPLTLEKENKLREILREYHLRLTEKDVVSFAQEYLSKFLECAIPQFHYEIYSLLSRNRLIIVAPRYFAKTTIISVIYALWLAITGKRKRIMLISATVELSSKWLRLIKSELESNEKILAEYGSLRTNKWSEDEIVLKNGVSIIAKGSGQQIRGYHPDCIIADDIEAKEEFYHTKEAREKLSDWFWKTLYYTLGSSDQLILIGTIQHPYSLLSELMKDDKKTSGWTKKFYRALENNLSIWEAKWSTEELKREKEANLYAFEAERQNNPLVQGITLFQREWLSNISFTHTPTITTTLTAIDPAISKKDTADSSAIITLGITTDKQIYEREVKVGKWSFEELLFEIEATYKVYQPMLVGIEVVAFQKAIGEAIRQKNPYIPIIELKADKDKRRRAMSVTHLLQQRLVHLNSDPLIEQLTLFTGVGDKEDDLVDALVYALKMCMTYGGFGYTETVTEPVYHSEMERRMAEHRKKMEEKTAWRQKYGFEQDRYVEQHLGSEW